MARTIFRSANTLGAVFGMGFFATVCSAQTVTVDASLASPNNSTTFNKLSTAIASFATGSGVNAGNVAANVINITPGTPVVDKVNADSLFAGAPVTIDGDLTIQGNGGLATFAGQPLSNTEQSLRVLTTPAKPSFAWRQPVALTIKNVAFIPTDPTQLLLFITKAPTGLDTSVSFEGCVFTANNGSNAPVLVTGKEAPPDLAAAGVIPLAAGGDALFALSDVSRGDLVLNVKNTVFASFALPHITSDGIVGFMQGATSDFINCTMNVNEGCVFANCGRGIQNPYGGIVNVTGTAANPVVFNNLNGVAAIWNFTDTTGPTQPTACNVTYARFFNLVGSAIAETETRAFINNVSNSVIANTGDGIALRSGTVFPPNAEANGTLTIDNVVVHNAGSGAQPGGIYAYTPFARTANVTNSVFTGPGKNGIVNNGAGIINVTNSTLSLTGANALAAESAGTGTINKTNISNAEVTYVNMTDPFSPDFFKVSGSSVNEWSVY